MRKFVCFIVLLCALFPACGCGVQATDETILTKTVQSHKGDIVISVPDNWEADTEYMDILVLRITDNVSAYAQIYYLAFDEEYQTLDDFLNECLERYSEDYTGEVQALEIDGMSAKKFEYIYEDFTENFEEAKFHGFEYFIDAPKGVIYIDIYNTLVNPVSDMQEVSTPQQRKLLELIAESLRIDKADTVSQTE